MLVWIEADVQHVLTILRPGCSYPGNAWVIGILFPRLVYGRLLRCRMDKACHVVGHWFSPFIGSIPTV